MAPVGAALLLVGIASVPATAVADPHAPAELPKLEIVAKPELPSKGRRPPPAGVSLVGNSLSDLQLQRLVSSLRALSAAQARRTNPFYVSLDDSDERATLHALLGELGPVFTAAAALAAGRWQSAEGDVILRPVPKCSASARCVSLLDEPADEIDRRARFLAWPLGYAILLRASSPQDAEQIAERLRKHAERTHVALVLTADDLHGLGRRRAVAGPLQEVAKLSARLVRRQPDSPFADVLKNLAVVASTGDELPWLKLPKATVLVVPRLGNLATVDGFVAEVRALLGAGPVEWLKVPR